MMLTVSLWDDSPCLTIRNSSVRGDLGSKLFDTISHPIQFFCEIFPG